MALRKFALIMLANGLHNQDKQEPKLLTFRRSGKHHIGQFEFPGGKIEPGEDPLKGILRELEEETSLKVKPEAIELLGTTRTDDVYGRGDVWDNYYYYLPPTMWNTSVSGIPQIMEKETHDWFTYLTPREMLSQDRPPIPTALMALGVLMNYLKA